MKAIEIATGREVKRGDKVADFRGDPATFVGASRATEPGRSGKVVVRDCDGEREFYASVFGLRVDA